MAPSPGAFTVSVGGETKVFFDPHPGKQQYIRQRCLDRVRFGVGPSKLFLRSRRGTGKSYLIRRGILHALAMAIPGFRYVLVRRNNGDLLLNHLQFLQDEAAMLGAEYAQTPLPQVRYANGSRGFYRQCEEFRDVEKIQGAEASVLFVDEAPQIAWDNLTLMMPSIRVPKNADGTQPYYTMVIFAGNPSGDSIDELDRHFLEKDITPEENKYYDPDDWEHIRLESDDNPSIDANEYLKMLGPIPPAFRAAWIDGERMESRTLFRVTKTITARTLTHHVDEPRIEPLPESMLGRPYHYVQEIPKIPYEGRLLPVPMVPWVQIYRTYDHGFSPDPAACVWLAVYGRNILAFSEETWFSTTAKDIAAKMIEATKELVGSDRLVAMTTVDPTIDVKKGVVTVMDDLEINGVPCEASINDRALYADAIHGLLGEEVEPGVPRFQIYEPGCPMLAKYLPKMRWDEKNPRKMADHQFDHWIVALAYFAISSGVLSNAQYDAQKSEPWWMSMVNTKGKKRA